MSAPYSPYCAAEREVWLACEEANFQRLLARAKLMPVSLSLGVGKLDLSGNCAEQRVSIAPSGVGI